MNSKGPPGGRKTVPFYFCHVERSETSLNQNKQLQLNEQSAYNQKDGPGVVNGGGDAGGIFVREWTHLRR